MKSIHIQIVPFFELLKSRKISMWEILSQLVNGEAQEILFINEEEKVLFSYILPETTEALQNDFEKFQEELQKKLLAYLN